MDSRYPQLCRKTLTPEIPSPAHDVSFQLTSDVPILLGHTQRLTVSSIKDDTFGAACSRKQLLPILIITITSPYRGVSPWRFPAVGV